MVKLIEEEKVCAFIMRRRAERFELLAFRIEESKHPFFRLPGGGVEEGEPPVEALYREIGKEAGLGRSELAYIRQIGKLEYDKPGIGKRVAMRDYLLLLDGDRPDAFAHRVSGSGKDRGEVFSYEWLEPDRFSQVDPELAQFLNPYNAPEPFMDARDFGLERDRVALRPHNETWKRLYEFEELEIRRGGEGYFAIDHIGSTSVGGLLAKPIIDILVGLHSRADSGRLETQLSSAGYRFRGECGVPGRLYFTKGSSRESLFHLHAFPIEDKAYRDHLAVKEALGARADLREKYEAYKLGARTSSREDYTEGKGPLMQEILEAI